MKRFTLRLWAFVVLFLKGAVFSSAAPIHDPLNIFCGSKSCYEILGVERSATQKEIKKAYRKLSLEYHPDKVDKSQVANATETFRLISKAYEVLDGNDSRPLFDYYLDHPRDYFKVSGRHIYRNLPKSDVRLVLLVVVGLVTWLMHAVQYQKYQRLIKYLKLAVVSNLSTKSGGTKHTMELYKRVVELYEAEIRRARDAGDKTVGKMKMQKDPLFLKLVDQVVSEVKVEGGYRKPEWRDLFIVRLVLLPYSIYLWAVKYHRRYLSGKPLSLEERSEMAMETVGPGTWMELSDAEQEKLIEMEIWKSDVYSRWLAERRGETIGEGDDEEDEGSAEVTKKTRGARSSKKNKARTSSKKEL